MILEQHYLACLSQASYLIGDTTSGKAVVVDPRRDIGEYLVGNDTNTIYAITVASQGAPFIRGDANGDGTLNLIDVTYHLQVLFGASSPTPGCQDALDADDNGAVAGGDGLTDVMYTLGYLFMGGPAPSAPFPACDVDPTDDALTCTTYESCP